MDSIRQMISNCEFGQANADLSEVLEKEYGYGFKAGLNQVKRKLEVMLADDRKELEALIIEICRIEEGPMDQKTLEESCDNQLRLETRINLLEEILGDENRIHQG